MYGGKIPEAIYFNPETIKNAISEFKKSKTWFTGKGYGEETEDSAKHIKLAKRDIDFYKNYLVVFVDFDPRIYYNAEHMYLGKLTSSQQDLSNFGVTNPTLSFDCNLLYTHTFIEEEFSKTIYHNGTPSSGVAIGFLPISDKDAVLEWAKTIKK
jgi:hypothetical protein